MTRHPIRSRLSCATLGLAPLAGIPGETLPGGAWAAVGATSQGADRPVIDDDTARADIDAFRRDAYAAHEDGATTRLFQYADANRKVAVVIDTQALPFLARKPAIENGEILVGAFLAGNLARQLEDGVKTNRPVEGIQAMCAAYRQLRAQSRIEEIAELEEWGKLSAQELVFALLQREVTDVTPRNETNGEPYAYRHELTGFEFPTALAGAVRHRVIRYRDVRFGETVTYVPPEPGKIDVILYTLGASSVPDGPSSSIVLESFAQAMADVTEAQKQGMYAKALCTELTQPRVQASPAIPHFNVAECLVSLADPAEEIVSWILLAGARNHILKIRYSAPQTSERSAREFLPAFLAAFFEANKIRP